MAEVTPPKVVTTHYIKNNDFKTVFSTALYGGVTVNGLIDLNFCIDRNPIPTKTESEIFLDKGQQKLRETKRESKAGLIKEVQVGILMDINMAKQTIDWLKDKIKHVEELQKLLPK